MLRAASSFAAPMLVAVAALGCETRVTAVSSATTTNPGSVPSCVAPLSPNDWFLVQQSVQNTMHDALEVAEQSTASADAVIWGSMSELQGTGGTSRGLGLGVGDCAGGTAAPRDVTCNDHETAPRTPHFCMQVSCTLNHYDVAAAITDPTVRTATSTHRLEYAVDVNPPRRSDSGTLEFIGVGERRTVAYAKNPSTVWHIERTDGAVRVSTSLDYDVSTTTASDATLDLSFTGSIALFEKEGDVPSEFTGDLVFERIGGGAIHVEWDLDDTHAVVGSLSRAGRTIATFVLPTATSRNVARTDWKSACQ